MNVSLNWLRDYLPISIPANELAEKIARTAVEIDDQYQLAGDMKKIVIARVLSVEPHPDSDHLVITQVDAGEDEPVQIVTGAPNVAAGQTVVLAKHGSTVGDHKKIRRGKLRGEVSNGMLVALQEIGLDDKVSPKNFEEGIWVFNEADAKDLVPGQDALTALGLRDDILTLGITPNRADMLSMNGTAWEVGAILDEVPTLPSFTLKEGQTPAAEAIKVTAPADLAPKYGVRVVKNVKVGDSPLWLQRRLWAMGIRPISNVVDVTNLMLLTYGQPLHAFDYDQLPAKELTVRAAQAGEEVTTLDGVERKTQAGDILITSADQPLMFAGVMGGASTEVTAQTQTVVLEAAIFEPKAIRHAARDQNLHSEASQRFERGVNVDDTFKVLDHAAALLTELAQGEVLAGRVIAQDYAYEAPEITISLTHINHVLGTDLTAEAVGTILGRLGFPYQVTDDVFTVTIPARRWDIRIPADLIEEVARIYGYDQLPTTLPVGEMTLGGLTDKQRFLRASRHVLEGLGLNQAISYALTTPEKAQRFQITPVTPVVLDYPMSQDHQVTRGSLITSLLDDVAYNLAHKQSDLALYEQGRVFDAQGDESLPIEKEHLAGILAGHVQAGSWDQEAQAADFFALKGIVEQLLTNLGFTAVRFVANHERPDMHPGQTADIYLGTTLVGFIGQIHPQTAQAYRIKQTFAFELDLTTMLTLPREGDHYEVISRFPSISRDLALLVDRTIAAADLLAVIKANGGPHLQKVTVFDVYTGDKVPADKKSLAYSLTFVSSEGTLVDADINAAMDQISQALQDRFAVQIR